MLAAMLPLPLPILLPCQALADWKRQANEWLAALLPRQADMPSPQQRQRERQRERSSAEERLAPAAQQAEAGRAEQPLRSCTGATESVPECCRTGFSSALFALLLPSLFHPHPPEHDTALRAKPAQRGLDEADVQFEARAINSADNADCTPWRIAAPDEHVEVLFDCPAPEMAALVERGQEAVPSQSPARSSLSPLAARLVRDMNEADVSESDEQHEAPACTNAMDAACPSGSAFVHLYERYLQLNEDVCW